MMAFGRRLKRVEDVRLLRGNGRFADDIRAVGQLHVAFLRSPHAHARIRSISVDVALTMPGVVAIETATSLAASNGPYPHPAWFTPPQALLDEVHPKLHREVVQLLASEKVRYVGEPVAALVATDRYLAEDALAAIEVDYQLLAVITDPSAAMEADAVLINEEWGENIAAHFVINKGDVQAAFTAATRVVRTHVTMPRSTLTPIENRGVVVQPEARTGGVTVWSSTQQPHWLRDALVDVLRLPSDLIHVIAPDVGGGFGVKSMVYPEELLVPLLALRLQAPIRWTEGRMENFISAIHGRDQHHEIELAVAADGAILGLRDRYLVDAGANNVEGLVCSYNTASHLQGPYRIPALSIECDVVVTNKVPNAAHRGAGRPEGVLAIESILDAAATALKIDGAELRRINTLRLNEMPYDMGVMYRDGKPLILDGGDYAACLDDALAAVGWATMRSQQDELRRAGRYIGLGVAGYIEGTGLGPYESALIRILPSGRVVVAVASPSQGQGHETTLAQICAEELGVDVDMVRVVQGDTTAIPAGSGTFDSRTTVVVGNAVGVSARSLRTRVIQAAADMLEAAPEDLDLRHGRISVLGSPARGIELGELARRLGPGTGRLTAVGPGLEEHGGFEIPSVTWANGVHACVVEVDMQSGQVKFLRYVVVHDCGRMVNPLIVEGQIMGGVVQGLGGALLEELIYDEAGQLITGSLMQYGLPRSTDIPPIEIYHRETRTDRNPLGVKGVGEGGAIPVAAAVLSAVNDALRPFNVSLHTCPVTADRILGALRDARASAVIQG
jgi:carbon-monoxide dehydrogenase large subunit